uniref:Uncharacterized protein n=1 Tax=Rhodosorus marinus TaxID=101924 RepID=A0A7S0BGV3_9RHOD|mmetsp:Transcript_16148/g.23435  ORF Transcript_16148/g.23435 Transcript_16148/m.23435 type:complete len:130 (+) Transcript_16148:136-525(+)
MRILVKRVQPTKSSTTTDNAARARWLHMESKSDPFLSERDGCMFPFLNSWNAKRSSSICANPQSVPIAGLVWIDDGVRGPRDIFEIIRAKTNRRTVDREATGGLEEPWRAMRKQNRDARKHLFGIHCCL